MMIVAHLREKDGSVSCVEIDVEEALHLVVYDGTFYSFDRILVGEECDDDDEKMHVAYDHTPAPTVIPGGRPVRIADTPGPERPELKSYGIPGSDGENWNPSEHGLEMTEEQEDTTEFCAVSWRPGEYHFDVDSNECFTLLTRAKLFNPSTGPDVDILRGIHEFLTAARPQA